MNAVSKIERRIVILSTVFVLVLFGLAALAINLFQVGLPTCLTDVKPFEKGEVVAQSPTHYEIHYVAKMWEFDPPEVVVPAGSTVDVYLSARDVTHGVILLGTNLNLMAVPGVVNYARVKLDQPRDYQLLCHEYCGTGHERMAAYLRVVDQATFAARQTGPKAAGSSDPGYKLLETKECLSCHSVNGQEGIGPTLKGVFGRATKLADGSTVTVDENYLRESLIHPEAKIVNGYDDLMPKAELTEQEIDALVQYMERLK